MKCDKCKWANWNRTKNGRLHPDKGGRCTKEIVIPAIPEAFYWINNMPTKPYGGYIERGRDLQNNCVYYEEN